MNSGWTWLHMGLCIGISGRICRVLTMLFGIGQNNEMEIMHQKLLNNMKELEQ